MSSGGRASILLLTRYGHAGASSRLRFSSYYATLVCAGFQVTRTPFFSDEYLERLYRLEPYGRWRLAQDYARRLRALFAIRSYDLIWVEKEVFPWLPAWFDNFLLGGRPVVIDYDDVWHLRYAEHPYPAIRRLLARKLESVVKRAAAVVAGNPIIAEWARDSGALRVVEIPTVVDVKRYPVQPLPHGPFTIGWIGTPITQKYLQIIAEPLRYMQARLGAKIRIIGASPDFCIPGVEIDRVRWSEDTEADEIGRCHVGVMRLAVAAWVGG
ncbi:MAG: glycosyltransferase family 4 protein [Candidatus Binatia bacterium]